METNLVFRLMLIGVPLIVIGIGAFMLYLGRYLAAPEEKKQSRAQNMQLYGLILVILALAYLVYSMFVLRG